MGAGSAAESASSRSVAPTVLLVAVVLGVGTLGAVQALATGLADLVLIAGVGPHELGLTAVAAVHPLWAPITLVPLTVVLLVFPDSRLVSPGWRPTLWLAAMVSAVASLVIRFRRSRGVTRQQLKWMAHGCALAVALVVVGGVWQDDTPITAATDTRQPTHVSLWLTRSGP